MIGDHGYGVVQAHDLDHTLNGLRLAVIDAFKLAAKHWAGRKRRHLHTWNPDVDAVLRTSVDLLLSVESLGRCADQPEVFWIFEGDLLWDRQRGRDVDQSTVISPSTGRHMDDLAFLGAAGIRVDAPR